MKYDNGGSKTLILEPPLLCDYCVEVFKLFLFKCRICNACVYLPGSGPFAADGNGGLTYGDVSSYAVGTKFSTTLRVTGRLVTLCGSHSLECWFYGLMKRLFWFKNK